MENADPDPASLMGLKNKPFLLIPGTVEASAESFFSSLPLTEAAAHSDAAKNINVFIFSRKMALIFD